MSVEQIDEIEEVEEEEAVEEEAPESEIEVEIEDGEPPSIKETSAEKRIKQLLKARGEADDRAARAEEALRRQEERAATLERQVSEFGNRMQALETSTHTNTVAGQERQAAAEMANAQMRFRKAYDEGNADEVATAQTAIIRATMRLERIQEHKEAQKHRPAERREPEQKQPPPPEVPPEGREWVDRHKSFLRGNNAAAQVAVAAERMAEAKGMKWGDPRMAKFMDETLQREFPDHFKPRNLGQKLGGAARTTPPKAKIKATPEDAKMASDLDIPLEKYMAEKIKIMREEENQ